MELLSFVERMERINEEVEGLQDDRKELLAEAKSTGFDPALIRRAVAVRRDLNTYREKTELLDTYLTAIEEAEKHVLKKSIQKGS